MKTLDEVIKALDACQCGACVKCPYSPYCDSEVDICVEAMQSDSNHYLKEYKNTDENYKKAIEHVIEVIDHYEKMVADYLAVNNTPLTWAELNQMEGEPVWIELLGNGHWKGWDVIAGFNEDDFGVAMVTVHNDDYYKNDLGKSWQAYRKERG